MKICIYGAGAVGGHIAGRLASANADVSVIARGAQLAAIREQGLRVETRETTLTSFPEATDSPGDLEPQDIVLVAVKAPSLPGLAHHLAGLVRPDGLVVFVGNGIPWWYFHGLGGSLGETHLPRLDPDGELWRKVGPDHAAGGVAYTAGTVIAPGVIRAENAQNRLILGMPDGRPDTRLEDLASALNPTGIDSTVTTTIRNTIWAKLISNTVGGSLGALTASATKDVLDKAALAGLATAMANEVAAVAKALGADAGDPGPVVSRLAASGHVQSVVQDLLAGRQMEIDALFRAPLDLAVMAGVPTPHLELVVELITQRARATGQYHDALKESHAAGH